MGCFFLNLQVQSPKQVEPWLSLKEEDIVYILVSIKKVILIFFRAKVLLVADVKVGNGTCQRDSIVVYNGAIMC